MSAFCLYNETESYLEKAMAPTPVLLPGKSHGQRSLVGCSPWAHEESDMTERLHFHFSLSCTGEENGNPFQCSCLENPRDGEEGGRGVQNGGHMYTVADSCQCIHVKKHHNTVK